MNNQLSSQDAVNAYGGNRFEMIIAAAHRARELARSGVKSSSGKHGPVVSALNEIEQGKYTRKDFLTAFQHRTEKRKQK